MDYRPIPGISIPDNIILQSPMSQGISPCAQFFAVLSGDLVLKNCTALATFTKFTIFCHNGN
jgi:hypothetical protein